MGGIRELLGGCADFDVHIRFAIKGKSPFSAPTPLPAATMSDARFRRDMPSRRLVRFWGAPLYFLAHLASNCALAREKWGAFIRPGITPSARKLRTASLKHLTNQHGVGGIRWMGSSPLDFRLPDRYHIDLHSRKKRFRKREPPVRSCMILLLIAFANAPPTRGARMRMIIWANRPRRWQRGG